MVKYEDSRAFLIAVLENRDAGVIKRI